MTNYPDSQVVQKIFENVRAEGNITVGKITQIYQIVSNLSSISKPTGLPQNISPSSTNKFVGRARDLERLHQQLQRQNEVVIAHVEGMGGVGKTELAIQYSLLHLQLHNYPGGICWLRATEQDIGLQIVQFAITYLGLQPPEDLELPERVIWCWSHWHGGNTLLVLDNVRNYSHIKPYLPPQPSKFKVLITTRLKLDLAGSLLLEVLQKSDALLLLAQLIGDEKIKQESVQAEELCQRLGNLPLALQLVGRYVNKRNITLAELLRRLERKGLAHPSLVVNENDPTWTLNVKHGVAAAFELSWEQLSDDAKQLGCLLSLFALAAIPWSLVERAVTEQDSEELEDARVELESLHLLQGGDTYRLHQLIQEFLRNKQSNLVNADEQKDNFCKALVEVAKSIPDSPTQNVITRVKDEIPHLAEIAQNLTDAVTDENLIWVFSGLDRFYSGQGLYALAQPWCKKCVSVIRTRLGEEHHDAANSYNNLALVYKSQGRYSRAECLYRKALLLNQRLFGEKHLAVAFSYNSLAALYHALGRYDDALLLCKKALSLRRCLPEENPSHLPNSYNRLAALYHALGRYSRAECLYNKALSLRQRRLGEEHRDVANSYNNLAELYQSQGRYSDAECLYNKALSLRRSLLRENHPDIAKIYNSLALLYKSQGRYSEAERLFKKALEIAELSLTYVGQAHTLNDD